MFGRSSVISVPVKRVSTDRWFSEAKIENTVAVKVSSRLFYEMSVPHARESFKKKTVNNFNFGLICFRFPGKLCERRRDRERTLY